MINNKREATPLFFILMLVHALLKTGQHILSFGQRVLVLGTFLKVQKIESKIHQQSISPKVVET